MAKRKPTNKNVPLDIADHPANVKDATIGQEVISEYQPLVVKEKQGKQGYNKDGVHVGTKNLIPLQPGQSGNPSGRAPDTLKAIGLRIAQLKAGKILKPKEQEILKSLGIDTADVTVIEHIMASLATSKNPMKVQMFMERVYGKMPNINLNAEISAGLVTRFRSKLTDSELEAIASGADAMDILFDKLPDVDEDSDGDIIDADAT